MAAPSQITAAPTYVPTGYTPVTINSGTGTSSTLLVPGQPGQGYFITEIGYQVSYNATLASAGTVQLTFTDSTFGTVASFQIFLPNAVSAPTQPWTLRQVSTPPIVWVSLVGNTNLSVAVNTALTGGNIRAFVRYGYCYGVGL